MTIDTTGQWWIGSDRADIAEYLSQIAEYQVREYRAPVCPCSSETFQLDYDAEEGCARRRCTECKAEHFICDSAEYASEAHLTRLSCVECGSERANVGFGFALREERRFVVFRVFSEPKWIYVGVRCADCGVLGCVADWKIDYEPAAHLLNQA